MFRCSAIEGVLNSRRNKSTPKADLIVFTENHCCVCTVWAEERWPAPTSSQTAAKAHWTLQPRSGSGWVLLHPSQFLHAVINDSISCRSWTIAEKEIDCRFNIKHTFKDLHLKEDASSSAVMKKTLETRPSKPLSLAQHKRFDSFFLVHKWSYEQIVSHHWKRSV